MRKWRRDLTFRKYPIPPLLDFTVKFECLRVLFILIRIHFLPHSQHGVYSGNESGRRVPVFWNLAATLSSVLVLPSGDSAELGLEIADDIVVPW